MFNFRHCISPFILALALTGCSDSTTPIDLRVGLFVAGEDQLSTRLDHDSKGIHDSRGIKEGELQRLDKALESTMTTAFRRVFASVDALKTYPTREIADNNRLDFVIVAELMGSGSSFGYESEGLWLRGDSDYSMSVKLTFYTHDMNQVTSVEASGKGSSDSIGIFSTPEKRALVKSVKAAIRNLGDDIVHQVHVNPDIRDIAEQNRE